MAKIAFVQQEMREQFGFMLMSAALKKAGHEVEVCVGGWLGMSNPDIIGFSSTTISFQTDLGYAKAIKKTFPDKFIIFGGPQPTYQPEETIKHDCIDAICRGEGIEAIVELADKLEEIKNNTERRNIKNIWFKTNEWMTIGKHWIQNPIRPISNINDWPRPDYGLYYDKYPELRNKPTKPVYIVRGCPYNCTFCYNPAFNDMYKGNKIFQCMDIDKAITEIKWLVEKGNAKRIQFMSDNMTINKKWVKEFFKAYKKEIGLPCLLNCRANEVNKDIIKTTKEAGCARVDFGVEHGNDYIRNDVLKRNMSKEQIINCGKWFKEVGIEVQTTNIFCLPHEDFNKAWESVELNRQFQPDMSKACILQPFDNTEIFNYAKENDLLKEDMQYSGTVIQVGVKDNRSEDSKIKIKNEYQILNLSRLFDLFVKWYWIPQWLGYIICSLPFKSWYKKYYAYLLKKQTRKYSK